MRPDRRWRSSATLLGISLVVFVLAAVPMAAAQDGCPPQSQAPTCTGDDPGGDPEPPADPPAEAPKEQTPVQDQPQDDGQGSDATSDSGASSGGTSGGSSGTGGTTGTLGSGSSGSEDATESTSEAPPPPPDLGPQRSVRSRLRPAGTAMDVQVVVDERDARGVDGGWSITVSLEGFPGGFDVTNVRPSPNARAVTRAPTGVFAHGTPHRLFAVFGQSSEQRYAGRYTARGTVELPAAMDGSATDQPPLVVITLFQ